MSQTHRTMELSDLFPKNAPKLSHDEFVAQLERENADRREYRRLLKEERSLLALRDALREQLNITPPGCLF